MSTILPAVVFVEAVLIIWLLVTRGQQTRPARASGGFRRQAVSTAAGHPEAAGAGGPSKALDFFAAWRLAGGPQPDDGQNRYDRPSRHEYARQPFAWRSRRALHCEKGNLRRSVQHDDGTSGEPIQPDSILVWKDGQNRLQEVWESLPVGMLAMNKHGAILAANGRAEKLFAYKSGGLTGKPVSLLVPELAASAGAAPDSPSFAAHITVSGPAASFMAKRQNGVEFPIEITFRRSCVKDDATLLAFIEDTTDRDELRRNRRDLAHLARVSTMGELAGSLAHELSQPLTAILSNVQAAQRFMAAESIDVAEVREILSDIVKDDYRASEIIRRIRSLVKRSETEFVLLDPAAVIRDVVLLLHSDAIARGIRVTVETCPVLPEIRADKVQLQQVVINLLLNAFDAMSKVAQHERAVSIALTNEDDSNVRIAVRDCGHGLNMEKPDTVFEPFFTSKPHGLGLGLSISRSIVELHGGRLWAENNLDRGATFYFTLPIGNAA